MKLKKPNNYLKTQIESGNLHIKSIKRSESALTLVYFNVEDKRTLRLKIESDLPEFLTDELLESASLVDFSVKREAKYMGYSTMICKNIKIKIGEDEIDLEGV